MTLPIMSFNLRYATADDGRNAWFQRKDILIQTIVQHAPLIVGTQEGLDFQLNEITQALPGFQRIGVSRYGNIHDEHCAILYDYRLIEVVQNGDFWLSETPYQIGSRFASAVFPRIVSWGKFRHKQWTLPFYIFNTHFDHKNEPVRQKSAETVLSQLASINDEHLPIILMGDFNSQRGSKTWQILCDGKLQEVWETVPEFGNSLNYTFHQFSGRNHGFIDWVFYQGPISPIKASILDDNRSGAYPSDHFPLWVLFKCTHTIYH